MGSTRVERRSGKMIRRRAGIIVTMLAAVVLLMGFAGMAIAETSADDGAAQASEKIDITVNAKWVDDNDANAVRPATVKVQLMADGKIAKDAKDKPIVIELAASKEWKATVKDLDKSKDGKAIKYTVAPKAIDKYKSAVKEVAAEKAKAEKDTAAVIEVTFTYDSDAKVADEQAAEEKDAKVADEQAAEEAPAAAVEKDDAKAEEAPSAVEEKDDAKAVPAPAAADDEAADEKAVDDEGFEPQADEEDEAGENDEAGDEPGEESDDGDDSGAVDITVTKSWDDDDDADGLRPDTITVTLVDSDGKPVEGVDSIALTKDEEWTGSFEGVLVEDGVEYTVEEDEVEGYTSEVSGSVEEGFTITNTHEVEKSDEPDDEKKDNADKENESSVAPTADTASKAEAKESIPTTSITATKVWKDKDNIKKTRVNITLHLQKKVGNGKWKTMSGEDRAIAANAAGDGLKVTWTDLPTKDGKGNKIEYRVTESWTKNYTSKVTGNAKDGFTVTNTLGRIPKTGDENRGAGAGIVVILIAAGGAFFAASRSRTRKE